MKKLFALLTSIVLVFSFTACQPKAANPVTSDSVSSNNGASAQDGGLTLTEDGVTPKGVFPVVIDKLTMTALIAQLAEVGDLNEHNHIKWLEEKTNIHLDMQITPSEGYADKKNILLSTGDYPELIMSSACSGNAEIIKYGSEEKIYIPINPYIEKYSEYIVDRWEEMPEIKEGMIAPDGNIYALPAFSGAIAHGSIQYKQWVNTSWLKKLNLEKPETLEDYTNMLRAFKNDDPNGNGQKDEVPLSGAYNTWAAEPYYFILNSFGYYDGNLFSVKDGKFEPTANKEYFKEGLKYLAMIYKEGLLDPASLTQDLAQMTQLANNENDLLGAYSAGHIGMGIDIMNKELYEKWDYLLPLKGPTGYRGTPANTKIAVSGGAFAITNKCKNPAAAIRMMDLLYGDFDSMPQQEYSKNRIWKDADPGAKSAIGLDARIIYIQRNLTDKNMDNLGWTTASGGQKNDSNLIQFEGDPRIPENYEGYLMKATMEYQKFAAPFDQLMPTWSDPETSSRLANTVTPIADYVSTSIVDFTTGRLSVDKDWQKYLDGLEALGYTKYVSDMEAEHSK